MFNKTDAPQEISCLNCETRFTGWFCPRCGQKSTTKKLNTLTIIKDFICALTDPQAGLLRTIIDLSQNPGLMIADYLDGKRKRYVSAGKYTLLLVVLFTVNISLLENHYGFFQKITSMVDSLSVTKKSDNIYLTDSQTQKKLLQDNERQKVTEDDPMRLNFELFGKKVNRRVSRQEFLDYVKYLLPRYHSLLFDTLKFFLVLWIPIFSFFSWVIFRKQKVGLAEHLAANSFIFSHMLLFTTLLSVMLWLAPGMTGTTLLLAFVSSLFYFLFSYLQVFSTGRRRLVKSLLVLGFGSLTYGTLLIALLTIQIGYLAIVNIDHLG